MFPNMQKKLTYKMKTDILSKISSGVSRVKAYTPGEQPNTSDWVKLNTNEFPFPPSPKVKNAIIEEIGEDGASLRLYPNPESTNLRKAIAEHFNVPREFAFAANGSDDILNLAIRAFCDKSKTVVTLEPSYSLYPVLAKLQDTELLSIPFNDDMSIPYEKINNCGANIFFFVNPNAPTGIGFGEDVVRKILEGFNGIVLVDEAYAPFANWSAAKLVEEYDNLIVTGTSSKGWGLAGMRIGWGLANPTILEVLDRVRDSYNLDRLAQVAGVAALNDNSYYAEKLTLVLKEREKIEKYFDSLGWKYFKSSANFVLFTPKTQDGKESSDVAKSLFEYLRANKILLRYFPNESSINMSIRLSIGTEEQMQKFVEITNQWINL